MKADDKTKKRMPARERGLKYPLEFVASELGVDRETLRRRIEAAGFSVNGDGVTFRIAYDALTQQSETKAAIRRKHLAEAEASEIDTLAKRKQFVFKTDHENIVKDLAVSTRVVIEGEKEIPLEARRKLIKKIAAIKIETAEASHK